MVLMDFSRNLFCSGLQNSRFRTFSEGGKRRKRLSPFSLAVFTLVPDFSFEYGPSLAFAKNTTVLQSIFVQN